MIHSIHLVVVGLVGSLGLLDQFHAAAPLLLHVNLVQTIHDILVAVRLLQAPFAVVRTAVRVLVSVVLGEPLRTRAFRVLYFDAVQDLLFNHVQNSRNNRCFQLLRINFRLLNMFSPQN